MTLRVRRREPTGRNDVGVRGKSGLASLALQRRTKGLDGAVNGNLESTDAHAGGLRGFLERHLAQLQKLDSRALTFREHLDGLAQLFGIAISIGSYTRVRDIRGIFINRYLVGGAARVASCLIDHAIVGNGHEPGLERPG